MARRSKTLGGTESCRVITHHNIFDFTRIWDFTRICILQIRTDILGHNNLLVAKLYEELAYATYVFEYSKGNFDKAEERAELAIQTMKRIIPANHLMVASSQRVLALVLEEIAIDMLPDNKAKSSQMLARAEELHLSAVKLTTQAFGEKNVQSAKHYGNDNKYLCW